MLGADCVTRNERTMARALCAVAGQHCADRNKPLCSEMTEAVIVAPPPPPPRTYESAPVVPAGRQAATVTARAPVTTYTKLPVAPATPAPIVPVTPPAQGHGIPTWVWIAGGVTALGAAALIFTRRKG